MKISFITTVFNEEKTIKQFLNSLDSQTKQPQEIIIVDGGSTDSTVERIKAYEGVFKKRKVKFMVLVKRGNRSIGRNEAIKNATGDIIICSDSGNVLDKDWIKNITAPFRDKKVDVVAGYYKGKAKNIFQKCLIPYVLVMPDKVDPQKFLPATRSIAFTKKIWKKVGGFDKNLSHNEDYAFANRLKQANAKIVFAKDAIVYWAPRNTFREAFVMFFRFAFGDAEAEILRSNVVLLFTRYIFALFLIVCSLAYNSIVAISTLLVGFILYILWSIKKNYKYIEKRKAIYILPLLQFTADIAVITGSVLGLMKKQRVLLLLLFFYSAFLIVSLPIGTPNIYHPFPYHMDEWHQLMAMKAILKEGTTTIPGAAQIPFLYPVISGIYLLPFIFFQVINPFSMRTPLDNLVMQDHLFQILRSVNILFGIGSIWLVARIAKKYLATSYILPVFFFVVSPILLMLSGYFKYDISLLFFIILSLAALYKFGETPSLRNFIYAAIACGLAFSVKFSAIPLLPLLIFAFFWFIPQKKRNYRWIVLGISFYALTFLLIGSPNILIGRADYRELLYSNLVSGPKGADNFIFYHSWVEYLLLKQYPIVFGHVSYFVGMLAAFSLTLSFIFRKKAQSLLTKNRIFLLISFLLFFISLLPLKIGATGNRALVLLPFLSLFAGVGLWYIFKKIRFFYKSIFIAVLVILMAIQFFETLAWIHIRFTADPQKEASLWVEQHIKKGETIGVENIPIYQFLPNEVVKEFYEAQYQIKVPANYHYQLVDAESKELPTTIIISNADLEKKTLKNSPKKDLLDRLVKEGYKPQTVFAPDLGAYRLFISDIDYYMSALIVLPLNITIFEK